tara:strand:+ start:179 stop:370 length:192 start_codon:yes stop_codon:yes gene_type:complete
MSILSTLSFPTLAAARTVVKKVHMQHYREDQVTDRQADMIIESLGLETINKMLKFMTDKGSKI